MSERILALLLLSMAGCDITGPSKVALHFSGTVTAQATGQPLGGAQVKLADPNILWDVRATTVTDAQGHYSLTYSIENCIDGDLGITLTAHASGLASETVTPACTESTQQFDFSLAPEPAA